MSKKTFFTKEIQEKVEREFDVKETFRILRFNPTISMSWGLHNPMNFENKAFLFKVNGYIHKGWVMITLGWNDTYTFRLLNGQYREVYKETEVYCDVLRDRIDEKVEKQSEYIF